MSADDFHALKRFILDKTEGNPFFMEEIVQTLREQGLLSVGAHSRRPLPQNLQLPTTVQGVLSARMDRLPAEEKALLQTLAVIGREFSASLLRKVVTQPGDDLHRLLSHLQAGEFVYEQPAFPEVEYIFKHALTQEVAYNSLLLERRKVLHERAAQAIEEVYRHRLDGHYSELAHHYSRSGNTQKAVDYLQLAGQQAVQRSAYAEAINQLTTALELLKTLPDTMARNQQELHLQTTLGPVLMAAKGWATPETEHAYTRARELCRQIGETSQLFPVLYGLWQIYVSRAELQAAQELGEQILILSQRRQDPALLLGAHFALGFTLYYLGEFSQAREHSTQGMALYDPQRHHSLASLYGQDPGVSCRTFGAWALWHLGYPDQALERSYEALILAQTLSHPFSLAIALAIAAMVHKFRQEEQKAREQAEAAITLCAAQEIPFFLVWSNILRGGALAKQGQEEEGIAQMSQGLASIRALGGEVWQSYWLALLTEAYCKVGKAEEGLSTLAEALIAVDKTGERFYEAELYRLKGELTLKKLSVVSSQLSVPNTQPLTPSTQEAVEEAEGYFLKAIDISRQQQAKSLELRATASLARLWQQQGKRSEAHDLLSEIYNWFTEGFDTKDLQEAKELLAELRR